MLTPNSIRNYFSSHLHHRILCSLIISIISNHVADTLEINGTFVREKSNDSTIRRYSLRNVIPVS